MPRANRHFLPGLVWHITHRWHRREFLLKFARDHSAYLCWLFDAHKRFGLCTFNSFRPAHKSEPIAVGSERITQEVKTRLGVTVR